MGATMTDPELWRDILLAIAGFLVVASILIGGMGVAIVIAAWWRSLARDDDRRHEPWGDASLYGRDDLR